MRKLLILSLMKLVACSGLPYDAATASANKKTVQKSDSKSEKKQSDSVSLLIFAVRNIRYERRPC